MNALIVELPPLESVTSVIRHHLFPDTLDDGPIEKKVLLEELTTLLACYLGIDNGIDYHDCESYLDECEYSLECLDLFEEILAEAHWREVGHYRFQRVQVLTTRGLVALFP